MSVQLSWYIEYRLVYGYGTGINTPRDLYRMNSDLLIMLDSSDHPGLIHSLIDLRDLNAMPSFDRYSSLYTYTLHPNAGWQIFIGQDDVVQRSTIFALADGADMRFRRFSTVEKGLAFLQSVDPNLPNLKAFQSRLINPV